MIIIKSNIWIITIGYIIRNIMIWIKNIDMKENTGFIIFLITEILIFGTLLGIYGYNIGEPSIEYNKELIPKGIKIEIKIGLINTLILIISGIALTSSELKRTKEEKLKKLETSSRWVIVFILLQLIEYKELTYTIKDSIYGNIFYITTGFHLIHVIISWIWINIYIIRIIENKFISNKSIIYFHLVDIIWIMVFITMYIL